MSYTNLLNRVAHSVICRYHQYLWLLL